jgi:hypothetical protein
MSDPETDKPRAAILAWIGEHESTYDVRDLRSLERLFSEIAETVPGITQADFNAVMFGDEDYWVTQAGE